MSDRHVRVSLGSDLHHLSQYVEGAEVWLPVL